MSTTLCRVLSYAMAVFITYFFLILTKNKRKNKRKSDVIYSKINRTTLIKKLEGEIRCNSL